MERYIKPSVKKVKTDKVSMMTKSALCNNNNARKMPVGSFVDKKTVGSFTKK